MEKLTFINRTKAKFDWDNYELQEEEGLIEDENGQLTKLPSEVPGIDIESKPIGPYHPLMLMRDVMWRPSIYQEYSYMQIQTSI